MNRFRFGIVAAQADSAKFWTDQARRIEGLGYSTLLVPDTVHTVSPAVACAVAAGATASLRVGPYVLASPNRTPGQVAIETKTLQLLTDDRYELGVGAGRDGAEADAAVLGMPFGSPRDRIAAVRATVEAVRAHTPGVRVLVAGSGPRMLGLAGRIADTVALGLPPDAGRVAMDAAVEKVRAGAAGRSDDVELSLNLLCVGDEAPSWLARYLKADLTELVARGSVSVLWFGQLDGRRACGAARSSGDQLHLHEWCLRPRAGPGGRATRRHLIARVPRNFLPEFRVIPAGQCRLLDEAGSPGPQPGRSQAGTFQGIWKCPRVQAGRRGLSAGARRCPGTLWVRSVGDQWTLEALA